MNILRKTASRVRPDSVRRLLRKLTSLLLVEFGNNSNSTAQAVTPFTRVPQ